MENILKSKRNTLLADTLTAAQLAAAAGIVGGPPTTSFRISSTTTPATATVGPRSYGASGSRRGTQESIVPGGVARRETAGSISSIHETETAAMAAARRGARDSASTGNAHDLLANRARGSLPGASKSRRGTTESTRSLKQQAAILAREVAAEMDDSIMSSDTVVSSDTILPDRVLPAVSSEGPPTRRPTHASIGSADSNEMIGVNIARRRSSLRSQVTCDVVSETFVERGRF